MGLISKWAEINGCTEGIVLFLSVDSFLKKGLFLAPLHFRCCAGLPLAVGSGGCPLAEVWGLLLLLAFLLRGAGSRARGLQDLQREARWLWPQAPEHRLDSRAGGPRRPAVCGVFPGQGSNSWFWQWQEDSLSLRHEGSPP